MQYNSNPCVINKRSDMIKFLNLFEINKCYQDELQNALADVAKSGWYLQGKAVKSFEQAFSQFIGTNHCVSCGCGLDALYLIYRAYIELGIMQQGDEVLVPANTFIATILALVQNGLKPILIEPRADTLEIDDSQIINALSSRARSILIVHLYGRCAYTERIGEICRTYGLKLVEDNAQAHGCCYNNRKTGAIGDAAAHSFYPSKNLGALGDGGAITTNDEQLAETVRALANYGATSKYFFRYQGRNSRLDELQAAVLRVKLLHLDSDNQRRQQIAAFYYERLHNPLVQLPRRMPDAQNVYHIFPVFSPYRDALQQYLASKGIETAIHYPIPPHKQACFSQWNALSLPITERIHQEELSLPISPTLSSEEALKVVEAINHFKPQHV